MVQLLEACGEKVLVILPERYLRAVVPNSSRSKGVKVPPIMGVRTKRHVYALAVVGARTGSVYDKGYDMISIK